MNAAKLRLVFCLAVAVLAAAVADPLLELASNFGVFGPGTFTDRSNVDVLPALFLGAAFLVAQVFFFVRASLLKRELASTWNAIRSIDAAKMLPLIFGLQVAVLFSMETLEQVLVYGHALGGSIWLGAPAVIGLCVHALFCAFACVVVARSVRALAKAAVHIVRILRACFTMLARGVESFMVAFDEVVAPHKPVPIACRIGMRAPPL